jgi:nicotinamide-nucleotide amidase
VGLIFETDKYTVIALPGPPRELQPMVLSELLPLLQRSFGLRPPACARTFRFVGLGQSAIYQTLHERVPIDPDLTLTSQFDAERVDVTFSLPQDTAEQRARMDRLEQQIRGVLGTNIYASDGASLEDVVVRALKAKGAGLLIVDLATGGQLGASLGSSADGNEVLRGAFVGPDELAMLELLGATSAGPGTRANASDRLQQLAAAAVNHTTRRPLYVLVVGQPARTASGDSRVELGFGAVGQPLTIVELPAGNSSPAAKLRLTTAVLDRLRNLTAAK